jgi:hypothetical protein
MREPRQTHSFRFCHLKKEIGMVDPVTSAAPARPQYSRNRGNPALIASPAPRVWLLRRTLRPPQRRRGAAIAGVALVTSPFDLSDRSE